MTKKNRRPQAPKPVIVGENKDWMRANLAHANRNNTVPSGKVYSRKTKHREW